MALRLAVLTGQLVEPVEQMAELPPIGYRQRSRGQDGAQLAAVRNS